MAGRTCPAMFAVSCAIRPRRADAPGMSILENLNTAPEVAYEIWVGNESQGSIDVVVQSRALPVEVFDLLCETLNDDAATRETGNEFVVLETSSSRSLRNWTPPAPAPEETPPE